ncbi:MAG: energy transducer TonB [Steroidobacteraceae bacterium]
MHVERSHFSAAAAISTLAAVGLAVLLVHEFLSSNTLRSAPIQSVALIAPVAQAPPPEAPKPEEEKIEKLDSTKVPDSSDWTPGEPGANPGPATPGLVSTDSTLGLAEAGGSGSDAFGLAGKPGGHELLLTTTSGSGGGNPAARYLQFANQLQVYLKQQLNQVATLTQDCYSVNVAVWITASGSIKDVTIRKSTGNRALDTEIRSALLQLAPMDQMPPSDMPWPVVLELVAHRADCNPEGAATFAEDRAHPP